MSSIKNICTVSDKNYLVKGLTLYESILKNTDNFILHYLCIDDVSYNSIIHFQSDTLRIYSIDELINNDQILKNLRDRDYRYFCWTLASYFTNHLMSILDEPITYVDSDIYFHSSFDDILNEISDNEVGVFRHRQFSLDENRPEGKFNVGVVHFRNGEVGKSVLSWWSDGVLNRKHSHLSTCGDQKYLDEFLNICPKDKIMADGNVGHGAPWHWQIYDLSSFSVDGTIVWENKKQKLVFTHFSQFLFIDERRYVPSTMHHCYTPLSQYSSNNELKLIYDTYFTELKKTKEKYKI